MDRRIFVGPASVILAAGAALTLGLKAESARAQQRPTLREYFEALVQRSGSPPASDKEGAWLSHQLETGSREEISEALPAILAAAEDKDRTINGLGVGALFAISVRADRYELLSKHLSFLTGLISSQDARAAGFALMTLATVWPQPPPDVLSRLLDCLKDADCRVHVGAIRYVVNGAADHPEAVAAVLEFWSRPMDNRARIDAINGLANGHPKDPRLINLLISALNDQAFEVRSAAFQRLANTPAALHEARVPMQRVAREYVNLVRRKDADPNVQIDAIQNLFSYAPDDSQVVNAFVEFYSRPWDWNMRRTALDALRVLKQTRNDRLIDLVVAALHDPNAEVRTDAAYVLKDMSPYALLRAEPALKKLAEDPAQPAEVKEGAKRALKEVPLAECLEAGKDRSICAEISKQSQQ